MSVSGELEAVGERSCVPVLTLSAVDHPLVGIWRLVSWKVVRADGQAHDVFGSKPKGYLIIAPEGRMMALMTAEHRTGGADDAERAALHRSMLSYSGRYRVDGDDFVTTVDVSWNEEWNGTEQRRHYRLEGDRLYVETVPAPSIVFPGTIDYRTLVWERER